MGWFRKKKVKTLWIDVFDYKKFLKENKDEAIEIMFLNFIGQYTNWVGIDKFKKDWSKEFGKYFK